MKLCLKILAVAIIAVSTFPLFSCSAPAGFSYQNVTVGLQVTFCADCAALTYAPLPYPQPIALPDQQSQLLVPGAVVQVPEGGGSREGCVELTAVVTNAAPNVVWQLYPTTPTVLPPPSLPTGGFPVTEPSEGLGNTNTQTVNTTQVGTLNSATGVTNFWCIPIGGSGTLLPIYTGAALQEAEAAPMPPGWNGPTWTGVPQGDVELVAGVPTDPSNPNACPTPLVATPTCAIAATVFYVYYVSPGTIQVILLPSTPKGQTNAILNVPPGTTYTFSGTAIGALPCTPTLPAAPATPTTCVLNGGGFAPANYTDNAIIWEIGPATSPASAATCVKSGPSCPYGTIVSTGPTTAVYTAPANALATTNEPVILAVSHATTSINGAAYITVN